MKNKKKLNVLLSILVLTVIFSLAVTAFAVACKPKEEPVVAEEPFEITIMFLNKENIVLKTNKLEVKGGYLEAALVSVVNSSEGKLEFASTTSAYGTFINSFTIDGTKYGTGAGEFVAMYHDDAENYNQAWGSVTIEEKFYGSSTLGMSTLPVKEGKTYIFTVGVYTG
ncbi:MAG TPA: hypothetical protein PKX91_05830 [Clostridia bacterium]|jgi:hypothetical protein|nr:hypothetical protein [Clostridia bacterium]